MLLHILLGALVSWTILPPLVKVNGWANGDAGDRISGSGGC